MAQQEFLSSLPEVVKHFSGCNLLLPTATDVQLNPFYKYHVEQVPVDISEHSGDIFKVGSTKTGKDASGKEVWIDQYSLSKPLLNKLAMAAGIQFNPAETYGQRIDKYTYRAKAMGAMKKADGTLRTETDQKEINLQDEEDKYRIEFSDKASKGILDDKQAKAAAELFKGKWFDTVNKWGRNVKAFLIDESERERYIERSVMVNMALLRKTWAEKAMTGAKLRVIRALLGLKGTYTMADLKKNFAIPTVVFSPDYSDPQVRQAMLMQGINSVNNMFGTGSASVKQISFEQETIDVTPSDMNNTAFQSDIVDDPAEDYRTPDPAESIPPAQPQYHSPQYQQPQQYQTPQYQQPVTQSTAHAPGGIQCCAQCGNQINANVYEFSMKKYGMPLCMSCQKGGR